MLEEGLQKSRHRAVPQWEDDDEMLRRNDGVSRLDEGFKELTRSKSSCVRRIGEFEARHFDPRDLVAGDRSTSCIGIGGCVAEALAACIGMALNKYLSGRRPGIVCNRREAMYPEDVYPESGCRLPLPRREQLDDAGSEPMTASQTPRAGRSGG